MRQENRIFIRPFTPLDIERILEIEKSSFTFDAFSEKTFENLYNKCPDLFIVAEIEGLVIGYMIISIFGDKSNVISIAVDPDYRRKGTGRILMEYALEKLKNHSIESVELEVRVTNFAGIKFWNSLGFSSLRFIDKFYSNGQNAIKMRKILIK